MGYSSQIHFRRLKSVPNALEKMFYIAALKMALDANRAYNIHSYPKDSGGHINIEIKSPSCLATPHQISYLPSSGPHTQTLVLLTCTVGPIVLFFSF